MSSLFGSSFDEPFLGEIRLVSFNFAPKGWADCNGQLLPINQNQALFALLGTQFGGDGRVNFALPDMRGRAALGYGESPELGEFFMGERSGTIAESLFVSQLPRHNHALRCTSEDATTNDPRRAVLARTRLKGTIHKLYHGGPSTALAKVPSLTTVGGSQPHLNQQPYLALRFVIALQGIFPSPT